MPMNASQPISDEQRRQVFLALVEAQDQSMTVPESREHVAQKFNISVPDVRKIEQEGLANGWPPL